MGILFHFRCDATLYAVDIQHVARVTWLPKLSHADGGPVWLTGVLNLQGLNVPVIDFARFMGHAPKPFVLTQKLLVLQGGDDQVALIVDHVDGPQDAAVLPLQTQATGIANSTTPTALVVLPLPHLQSTHSLLDIDLPSVLLGQVRHGDEWVMLVNAEKLLDVPHHWPAQGERADLPGASDDGASDRVFMTRMHQLAVMPDAPNSPETPGQMPLAIVSTGSRKYAIALADVVEFTQLRQLNLLPGCPTCVVGCMNLRGEILAIVDIGLLAGGDASPPNANVVVVQHQGHKLACLIATIERLVLADEAHRVAVHDHEALHPLAKSLLRDGHAVTPILHLEALVALCQAQQAALTPI